MEPQKNGRARAWVEKIVVGSNFELNLERDSIVVVVGPNNSGKSTLLRRIREGLTTLPVNRPGPQWLSQYRSARDGSVEDLRAWLDSNFRRSSVSGVYVSRGAQVDWSTAEIRWSSTSTGLEQLAPFFAAVVETENRLHECKAGQTFDVESQQPPTTGLQTLLLNPKLVAQLSAWVRSAFGFDVVLQPVGTTISLRKFVDGSETDTLRMPPVHAEGDGVRSYIGLLLALIERSKSLFFIDEPEAFLHPPQCPKLGQLLVDEVSPDSQMFIATHSIQLLQGLLDSKNSSSRVRVLRTTRVDGGEPSITQLGQRELNELWNNPVVRNSNLLDSLFHQKSVLCESEGDCRFYQAIADSLPYERSVEVPLFLGAGGKDAFPGIILALHPLGVRIVSVLDMDVLRDWGLIQRLLDAHGVADDEKGALEAEWVVVDSAARNSATGSKDRIKILEEVREEIQTAVKGSDCSDAKVKSVRSKLAAIKEAWVEPKQVGLSAFKGDAFNSAKRLLHRLGQIGILVVPVGELECFHRGLSSHKSTWLGQVLLKDLAGDPDLKEARDFVLRILTAPTFLGGDAG
ncbi:MAG: AAA family ATPase [Archangiaceae bacterium]|nr:AAA family ATPase [Archangiaceae bacterium]